RKISGSETALLEPAHAAFENLAQRLTFATVQRGIIQDEQVLTRRPRHLYTHTRRHLDVKVVRCAVADIEKNGFTRSERAKRAFKCDGLSLAQRRFKLFHTFFQMLNLLCEDTFNDFVCHVATHSCSDIRPVR